eukprot:13403698-Alexandrium_andersonii.AAC.1
MCIRDSCLRSCLRARQVTEQLFRVPGIRLVGKSLRRPPHDPAEEPRPPEIPNPAAHAALDLARE